MRHFRAGDLVRFGTYEGRLYVAGDFTLALRAANGASVFFEENGSLGAGYVAHNLGPVLTLIEAAPEKPKRKEFMVCGSFESMLIVDKFPEGNQKFTVREVLEDDLPAMTKAEAREWLKQGFIKWAKPANLSDVDMTEFNEICGYLGISEDS